MSAEEVLAEISPFLDKLKPMVKDTAEYLNAELDCGKTVLFEGGQATMLDVDYGTYPYVTSSNPTAGGAITGTGVGPMRITSVVGVAKAYTTRVGEGPFPTELQLGAEVQAAIQSGAQLTAITSPKTDSDYGQLLLQTGGEFGTTTGRPRRCGWYDSVVVRWASLVNGLSDLVLTKLDVLTGIEKIKVCVSYEVDGVRFDKMPTDQYDFERAKPIYQEFDGWNENISGARNFSDLPLNAQKYVQALEELSNCRISVIGVGASRDAIIQLHDIVH
jgi:adenylosuccinate synthase